MKYTHLLLIGTAFSLSAFTQANSQESIALVPVGPAPTYSMTVTSRSVEAVNYEHRSGATDIDFKGTALMPSAEGQAKVRSKRGTMEVEATFSNLQNPTSFGGEYLTYVLWAISPDGHAVNLGEALVGDNDRSKLTATTNLQSFALIVTAEPYFAVREPSNVVVLENAVRDDTRGTSQAVNAKYELMERGGYIPTGYKFDPVVLDADLPLEFLEARNAMRIAQSEGAEQYAGESYKHGTTLMDTANGYATDKHSDRKQLIATSRETVQTAEDARQITLKKIDEVRRTDERMASENAQALSQAQADRATRQKEQAQSDTAIAQAGAADARANAADARSEMASNKAAAAVAINSAQADAANSQYDAQVAQAGAADARSEMASNKAAAAVALNSAQADAANSKYDADTAHAGAVNARADAADARSEMATNKAASALAINSAQSDTANAQADADQSRQIAHQAQLNEAQANTQKAAMRAELSEKLNKILATRDSARGLIVSMSDVLFDTGKYSLMPGAREKLARVAGILIAYPGLSIAVGGYTDNVGGDAMNQKLSENRAGAVRDYMQQQGVSANSLTAKGFGNSSPVASNDNSAGRQENRRVELVVSGDAIGGTVNVTTGSLR